MFTPLGRPLIAVGLAVAVLALASPSMANDTVVETAPSYDDLVARLDALPSTLEANAVYDAAAARAEQAFPIPQSPTAERTSTAPAPTTVPATAKRRCRSTSPLNCLANAPPESRRRVPRPTQRTFGACRLAGRSRASWH